MIPFQIKQLFTNLIANSLKYRKAEGNVQITILYQEVTANANPVLVSDPNRNFHEITFIDNGLGFEQEYAEKVRHKNAGGFLPLCPP